MRKCYFVVIMLIIFYTLAARNNVHLFQNFYRDALISPGVFAEGSFEYSKTEMFNFDWTTIAIGMKGGYPINNRIEAEAGLSFISITPEEGDGESGISDLNLVGKYLFTDDGPRIAAGARITVPVGSEDIGQGNLNFGFFGALRNMLSENIELTGTVGIEFFEVTTLDDEGKEDTEYETALILGAGTVYSISEKIAIVPEFMLQTEVDYTMLSCGLDYKLSESGSVRGMFGIGMDDGAPDLILGLSYLAGF